MEAVIGLGIIVITIIITMMLCSGFSRSSVTIIQKGSSSYDEDCDCECTCDKEQLRLKEREK